MRVYRIETTNGKGICAVGGSKLCMIYRMAGGKEQEHCSFCTIRDENKAANLCSISSMKYAFPSMEALRNWFPTERGRKAMEAFGATGVIYEVPNLEVTSKYQCVFDLRKAVKVGTFAL